MNTPSSLEGLAEAALDAAERAARPLGLPYRDVRQRIDDRAIRGYTESSRRFLRVLLFAASDILAGLIAVYTILLTWKLVSAGGLRPLPDQVPLIAAVVFLQPLALYAFGAYAGGRARIDFGRLAAGIVLAAFLGWIQAQLFGRETADLPNKAAYLYLALTATALAYSLRRLLDWTIRIGFRTGRLQRRMLVVGSNDEVAQLIAKCAQVPDADVHIAGSFAPPREMTKASGAAQLDQLSELEAAIIRCRAHGVIVVSSVPFDALIALMGRCYQLGVTVSLLPRLLKDLRGSTLDVRQSAVGPLLEVAPLSFDLPQLTIKRTMDLSLVTLGLILIWPVLALIAIAIKLDSSGPVLFRQTRAGLGGDPFEMFKFRTMLQGSDAAKAQLQHLNESGDPRLFKIRRDPRVTRVGRILRRLSLDELPQIFNVLRGEMSLVGPRPFFPGDLSLYERHHFERLHVLPGITGLWQVSGRSDVVDFEEVVRLDLEYIRDWSVLSDVTILVKTIPAAFGRGAY